MPAPRTPPQKIVVELGIAGQPARPPVLPERLDGRGAAHAGRRPDDGERAVERDPGQDVELDVVVRESRW